jgi:hypothetical protein
VNAAHSRTASGRCGIRAPRMNDNPAARKGAWLASEIMPASATTVHIGGPAGGLEGVDHRQHGGGLGPLALERGYRRLGEERPGTHARSVTLGAASRPAQRADIPAVPGHRALNPFLRADL